ncbi:MAG: hypothetical protein WCI72_00900 [archaeon]
MPERKEVYDAIEGELSYQKALVKQQDFNTVKTVGEYLACLGVYLRKAEDAWNDESDHGENRPSLQQMRKIAALAVSCMEQHGAPTRDVSDLEKRLPK